MNTKRKTTVSVFCASEAGTDPIYGDQMYILGVQLARSSSHIIYGGGGSGLMGALSAGATDFDGSMTALIPPAYFDPTKTFHPNIDVVRCDDATDRLNRFMASDFNIVAPGGFGTMGEIGVAMTHVVDSLHGKDMEAAAPLIFFNVNGCWNPMREQAKLIVKNGLGTVKANEAFIFTDDAVEVAKIVTAGQSNAPRPRRT